MRSLIALLVLSNVNLGAMAEATKYVRYDHNGAISYGVLDDDTIHELAGPPFASVERTGKKAALSEVRLLAPCEPSKVIAVGLNFRSHLGDRPAPAEPPLFAKMPTCIVGPGDAVVIPPGATDVHFETELVLVIGKRAKNVSEAEARDYIFGITCGNDVSERAWQAADLQWLRAKASDTFGPIGPCIVTGLDIDNVQLEGRLNGETVQSQRSSDLIHNSAAIVSFASRYITLEPGDVIFTGTPGSTKAMKPGDTFEVEIEGVGVLSNPVKAGE